jgi:diguanylate cyclase
MKSRVLDLVLGTEHKQRLRLARSLGAMGVYAVCLLLELAAVGYGLAKASHVAMLTAVISLGLLVFYIALRSGWSQRMKDPALTMPQMVFSMLSLMLAYGINPRLHGVVPMLMALVLVFGAFILPPQRCRQLGWLSVAALASGIVGAVITGREVFEFRVQAFDLLFCALVLPTIANLAGQLSALRSQQQRQKHELRAALEQVRQLATHDELTGLPNRRQAQELLAHEERKALRGQASVCCCLIDIDYFKQVNDTKGHHAGDLALQLFSRTLGSALRAGDVLARWGGEEFMLLMPSTTLAEATQVMARLRERCADARHWVQQPDLQVTFSAGLSALVAGEPSQQLVARADAALYKAKRQGRDRTVVG